MSLAATLFTDCSCHPPAQPIAPPHLRPSYAVPFPSLLTHSSHPVAAPIPSPLHPFSPACPYPLFLTTHNTTHSPQVGDPVIHIELRRWADALVIAPLSANTLAKMAGGLCDNLLTCVVRAWDFDRPVLVSAWDFDLPATVFKSIKQSHGFLYPGFVSGCKQGFATQNLCWRARGTLTALCW